MAVAQVKGVVMTWPGPSFFAMDRKTMAMPKRAFIQRCQSSGLVWVRLASFWRSFRED